MQVVIFPGVGAFGSCFTKLEAKGLVAPLRAHIAAGKPLLGICVGLQLLFEGSDESPECTGLGILRGRVGKYGFSLVYTLSQC